MYNIIIKTVVYLSLITAFFIIILNSGLSESKKYFSWKNSTGVSQITEDISEIPQNKRNDIKIFNSNGALPWLNNLNSIPFIKILYGLITLFVLMTFSRNAINNISSYRIKRKNEKLKKIIRDSNILTLTKKQFRNITSSVLDKQGYNIKPTHEGAASASAPPPSC